MIQNIRRREKVCVSNHVTETNENLSTSCCGGTKGLFYSILVFPRVICFVFHQLYIVNIQSFSFFNKFSFLNLWQVTSKHFSFIKMIRMPTTIRESLWSKFSGTAGQWRRGLSHSDGSRPVRLSLLQSNNNNNKIYLFPKNIQVERDYRLLSTGGHPHQQFFAIAFAQIYASANKLGFSYIG